MFTAKKKAEKENMRNIETDTHTYRITKQVKQENKDFVGEIMVFQHLMKTRKKHGNSIMKGY